MSINVNFRTDEQLKKEAESIYRALGMNMTTALNMFLRATVREKTIPFPLNPVTSTLPTAIVSSSPSNDKAEDIEWEDYNPMLYDVMRETANRLGGRYIYLSRNAKTEEERQFWLNKDLDFRDEIDKPFPRLVDVQEMQADLNKRLKEVLEESVVK